MRDLMKLLENNSNEEEAALDALAASFRREKKVEALVQHVFEKLELEMAYRNRKVSYDEESRQCLVYLEGSDQPISALAKLDTLGLGSNFRLNAVGDYIVVEFIVAEGIEDATPQ